MPLLGLSAAFLFAAQMVNFPVAGGTSGHLVGGALVAAPPGPGAAVVVLTTVLIVQCFLFGDGGVTALGANIFNMGIINSVGGYVIYRAISGVLPGGGRASALAFAAWAATVLAAISCAGQLAWSGTIPWSVGFPAMTGVHMPLIGIGEGLISALVFLAIQRTRPELISAFDPANRARHLGELPGYGLLVTLGVAVFVAPFACTWPDGLDSSRKNLRWPGRSSCSACTRL